MTTLNITEAKAKLSQVVDRVSKGESIILTRMGKPVAKISKYEPARVGKRTGIFDGKIKIADDFDEWPHEEAHALGIID